MVIAFHKPYGVLCQFTPDQPGQRTLADFGFPPGVYPVGRLDMDSEGLLLLSDEAGFNNRLLDPKTAHPRTYLAQVEGIPTQESLVKLARGGLEIQGHCTLPCKVQLLKSEPELAPRNPPVRFRQSIPTAWLELQLIEGKNRQVLRWDFRRCAWCGWLSVASKRRICLRGNGKSSITGRSHGSGCGSGPRGPLHCPGSWGDTGAATHILCWGGLVFRVSETRKRAKKVMGK
jgi:23S rRNA pseudouridine2457 synthase